MIFTKMKTISLAYFQNFILNEAMVNLLDLKRTASLYNYTMEIFNSYSERSEKNIIKVRYENLVSKFDKELNREEIWKVISYIRSLYSGSSSKIIW